MELQSAWPRPTPGPKAGLAAVPTHRCALSGNCALGCAVAGGGQRGQPAEHLHASHLGASAGQKPLPGPSCSQEQPCWRCPERAEHSFWYWSEKASQSESFRIYLWIPSWVFFTQCWWSSRDLIKIVEYSRSFFLSFMLQEFTHFLLSSHQREHLNVTSDKNASGLREGNVGPFLSALFGLPAPALPKPSEQQHC